MLDSGGAAVSDAVTASARILRPWSFRSMNGQLQYGRQNVREGGGGGSREC